MAEAAVKDRPTIKTPSEPVVSRRFEMPDLQEHGGWLLDRLRKLYPGVTDQSLWGRLNSILYNSDFLFLYQKDAVGVAEVKAGNSLEPAPAVHEWFTFVREPADAEQVERAAAFYGDYLRWARALGAEAVILSEVSDVPHEQAAKSIGVRLFTREQAFVNVKG